MEGLLKASSFNFGRMLFGDGDGKLSIVNVINNGNIYLTSVKNLVEGMVVDFRASDGTVITNAQGRRILSVDRETQSITVSGTTLTEATVPTNCIITIQGSYQQELTGLGAIFKSTGSLYGINRDDNKWMIPYMKSDVGDISETIIQTAIDNLDERAGSNVDFIVCSAGVKRAYQNHLATYKRNIDVMDLAGGYKALSYNGIPLVSDRFCPTGTMYMLNTKDFTLHQLCDWKWLEGEDGRVIKQVANKPVYTATLVKYADLICSKPIGQAMLSDINEA